MIKVKYSNDTIKEYKTFDEISDGINVISIDCSNNELTQLPENMNFPNLQELNCFDNKLTQLPENTNLPNLQKLDCSHNKLTQLSENINFPNLKVLDCSNNKLTQLPENMNFPNLQELNCSYNQLRRLPVNMNFLNLQKLHCFCCELIRLSDNMNLPNLQELICWDNQLTQLPENMNFPNLQKINCCNNKLTQLPENMNFPNLQVLKCSYNELTQLPENMNFPNLQVLYCYNNKLTQLPENMNFPNLQKLHCYNNELIQLPKNMNFPNLQKLYCWNNKLTRLPLCILNFRHLKYISYENNEIELSSQIARFIRIIQNKNKNSLNVYNDGQNIHNVNIQVSVKDSINNITTRTDLPKFNQDNLISYILQDDTLLNKDQLIEYSNDENVHSLLLLTFPEVLWYTLQTIIKDFDVDTQQEIKSILNQEMADAECKCFTGRINRVINCLNGFSPLVSIRISDNEQIGNIIVIIKEKLELTNSYTIETHKEFVIDELEERGYSKDIIDTWIGFIE